MSAETMVLAVKLTLLAGIMLTVVAVGLKATWGDPTSLFRHPSLLIRSMLAMSVLTPIVACVMAAVFHLHPAVRIALVTLAVSPVPPFLPMKEATAGGQSSYIIGLLFATGLLAIVFIPLTLVVLAHFVDIELDISMAKVASTVAMTVLVPLLVGIGIRAAVGDRAERLVRPTGIVAAVLLILGLLAVLVAVGPGMWALVGNGTLAAMAVYAIIALGIGHVLGGPLPGNRATLGLSAATRHPGVALAIASANFPDQTLALPAILLFAIVGAVVSAPYVKWARRNPFAAARGAR
jgi:bile acid:Na+ symporter, BASS family